MRKQVRILTTSMLAVLSAGMYGCSQQEKANALPQPVATATLSSDARAVAAHTAWQTFVDQVERGEQTDPSGQYVAKGTQAAADAAGHRVARPKFDAATPAFGRHYRLRQAARAAQPVGGGIETYDIFPCDPCGNTDGPAPVTSQFISSVNKGGSGQIHDLKLISNSSTSAINAPTGYVKLNSDLNRGAGGAFIYLCFTRNTSSVLNGLEYHQNYPYTAPTDVLTSFQTKFGSFSSFPTGDDYFYNIWSPNQYSYAYWDRIDLNGGAGGEYIYSFQSKSPLVPKYRYVSEVGILSGSSSTIQPPSGWEKYPQDLNAGAGGDFIYFCYR